MKDMMENGITSTSSIVALFCLGTSTILYGSLTEVPFSNSTSSGLLITGIIFLAMTLGISLWKFLQSQEDQEKTELKAAPQIDYQPIRSELETLLTAGQEKKAAQRLRWCELKKIAPIIIPMSGEHIAALLKHSSRAGEIRRYLLNDCGNAGLEALCKVLKSYPIKKKSETPEDHEIEESFISLRHQLWREISRRIDDPFGNKFTIGFAIKFLVLLQEKEHQPGLKKTCDFFQQKNKDISVETLQFL